MGSVYNIQRGIQTFGASADSDTSASFTPVSVLANSFGRLSCSINAPTLNSSVAADRFNDDMGMGCLLTSASVLTLNRLAAGTDEDMRCPWEIWEFPDSGNDQVVVRAHGSHTLVAGDASDHVLIGGISTLSKCIPVICGITSTATTELWDAAHVTASMLNSGGNGVTFTRGTTTGDTTVYYAILEFVGSNWSVQNNLSLTFAGAGSDETIACSAVTWANTVIFPTYRTTDQNEDEVGYTVREGSSTTTVRARRRSGATGTATVIVHLASNSNLTMQRIDSITGGGTAYASGDATVNHTISAVPLARSFVIATVDSAGTGANYPREFWNHRLSSTTNVEGYRARTGQGGDYAIQVGTFADLSGGDGGKPYYAYAQM